MIVPGEEMTEGEMTATEIGARVTVALLPDARETMTDAVTQGEKKQEVGPARDDLRHQTERVRHFSFALRVANLPRHSIPPSQLQGAILLNPRQRK